MLIVKCMKMELAVTEWMYCAWVLKRALVCLLLLSCGCTRASTVTAPSGVNTLYLVSLLPYPDSRPTLQPSWEEGPTLTLAGQLAVELINSRRDVLSDYNVELIVGDSGCDVKTKAVTAFVENVIVISVGFRTIFIVLK